MQALATAILSCASLTCVFNANESDFTLAIIEAAEMSAQGSESRRKGQMLALLTWPDVRSRYINQLQECLGEV